MFLSKFPECDGRNVVVAILDTGTDPGAPGLNATCPDGRPKIIDVVDATGSGDIDMSTVRQGKLEDGKLTVEGKAGRTLTLNDGWSNPTGDFRVGAKPLYDVIPGGLASRIKKARRKVLDEAQRAATDKARTVLSEFDAAHPASKPLSEEDKAMQRELKAHLEQLENAESIVEDLGPVIDAVVWHDGSDWRAVVGTTDDGDVSALEPLTNFRTERKYGTLTGENLDPAGTLMNYAINIFDEGSVLSVVCDSGAHGTHVAGIVGACHEDAPEFNGVAPGAQIVAVKIGDSRLDGMETTSALVRGLRTVLDNGCDLINLSFGEAASPPNVGRFLEKAAEVVNKHGVIFISSAGNNGPAYTTVGAPGGTCEEIISCGAYVTPAMMEAEYSMLERVPSTMTTWSSRGPAQDGSQGVQLTAPGAAITSVPTWTLQRGMLMNGTSMSAPNLTGCVALVLSACKAHSIPATPARVRHALISTAKPLPGADRSEVGHGIVQVNLCHPRECQYCWNLCETARSHTRLSCYAFSLDQVDACFEYLKSRADKWKDDISYDISVSMPGHGKQNCEAADRQTLLNRESSQR
jgi:tripeptidyl-peptidase-2